MSIIKEFKEFAIKGNVVDLAVAVIIGGAFGKIVSSFVADIVTPLIGLLFKADFADLKMVLKQATFTAAGEVENAAIELTYGNFITAVIDFLIIAWAIFMVVKGINATKKKEEAAPVAPPAPAEDVVLLREIRDLLRK
jgi:large conductance mechanosensitive channel